MRYQTLDCIKTRRPRSQEMILQLWILGKMVHIKMSTGLELNCRKRLIYFTKETILENKSRRSLISTSMESGFNFSTTKLNQKAKLK